MERTTCAGTRWASSGPSRVPGESGSRPATPRPSCSARRWTKPPASCWTTTSRRRRKVGDIDNRGSHSTWRCTDPGPGRRRTKTPNWPAHFAPLAKALLTEQEATIVAELNAVQGKPAEIGGYYRSNPELTSKGDAPQRHLQRGDRGTAWLIASADDAEPRA
ncbi:NADP-dependent isocitrate dehydrogenase [Pseudomonas aeruginosa]